MFKRRIQESLNCKQHNMVSEVKAIHKKQWNGDYIKKQNQKLNKKRASLLRPPRQRSVAVNCSHLLIWVEQKGRDIDIFNYEGTHEALTVSTPKEC